MRELMPGRFRVGRSPLCLGTLRAAMLLAFAACSGARPQPPRAAPPPEAEEPLASTPNPGSNEPTTPGSAPESAPAGTAAPATEPPLDPTATSAATEDLLATERAAYERARPVFERHCTSCHTKAGKGSRRSALRHFSMDAYPFGGHHTDEMAATIREVLGADGGEPTMPRDRPGAVQDAELAAILEWAAAFERSHAAGLHGSAAGAHEHDHGRGRE